MAGQNAVLDAATIERKPHMGAPVVESEYVPVRMHEENRTMLAVHNHPPLDFQFLEGTSTHEVWTRRRHMLLIRQALTATSAKPL
jgi:hypothetical protein